MNTLHPICFLVGINLLISLFTTVTLDFFGTTWIGLTYLLSKRGLIIPTFNSFKISFLTPSCMVGFNLLHNSLEGLAFSSRKILWVHTKRLIPFKSPIFQLNALLCLPSISNNLLSYSRVTEKNMTIGYDSFSLKNAYLRMEGRGFNSILGGANLAYFSSSSNLIKCLILSTHVEVSMTLQWVQRFIQIS